MKYTVLLLTLTFSLFSVTLFAQDTQQQLEQDVEQLKQDFSNFFSDMFSGIGEGQDLLKDLEFEKSDLEGWFNIDGDSLNISYFFNQIPENLELLPEWLRPSEEHLNQQKDISKMLPDLMEKSQELFLNFNNPDFDFEAWRKSIEQLEPNRPHSPNQPRPTPKPTTTKKKKHKTTTL